MRQIILSIVFMLAVGHFCPAYPASVFLGSEELDVAFDDPDLTLAEKTAIVEDVRNVLSTTSSSARTKRYDADDKKTPGILGRIDTGTEGHLWPRAYWKNGFGEYRMNQKTGKRELVISKNLSDSFRGAIAFGELHKKAVDELDVFLTAIEKGFDPSHMSYADKQDLIWFSPGQRPWPEESYYDANIREMKTIRFHRPSIMTFKEDRVEEQPLVYCKPVVQSKTDDSIDQMMLVYVKGKWRIRAF